MRTEEEGLYQKKQELVMRDNLKMTCRKAKEKRPTQMARITMENLSVNSGVFF